MRKIAVITGSRAEYGLLSPLLRGIAQDNDLKLQLIVTGAHLSPQFGLTVKMIEKDGFNIEKRVKIVSRLDTPMAIAKSMALGLVGFSKAYSGLKPDIILVLGDRYEIFSAVSAGLVSRIPVAHIGGGDSSEGAIDEALRSSVTKMSHLHFTICEAHRSRVIQLGEDPARVFNVGSLGLDNIESLGLLSKDGLEKAINFKLNKKNILITFHPCTLESSTAEQQFKNLLSVLDELEDTNIIFTKPNADIDGRVVIRLIDDYVAKNRIKSVSFDCLGTVNYFSALQFMDAVVGNSSSGIIEAPRFKIGTIDIGDRQKGRIKADSVISCQPACNSIRGAFRVLYSDNFKEILLNVINPYQGANTAKKIKEILKQYELAGILKKSFRVLTPG